MLIDHNLDSGRRFNSTISSKDLEQHLGRAIAINLLELHVNN